MRKVSRSGIARISDLDFLHSLQLVTREMLSRGKDWEAIDTALRHSIVHELTGTRALTADEAAELYRVEHRLIDGTLLRAVGQMKRDCLLLADSPNEFLERKFGLVLPPLK